jgi:type IV secretory pathway TraG/TraD family ATPase VirD4
MKQIDVFEGDKLYDVPIQYPVNNPNCAFLGQNKNGENTFVPLDADLLSRHIMFLGGIGTGKTNAFSQLISQIRNNVSNSDVVIIFDTKGDFYNEFYRKGDIVISNDDTATGTNGKDYWNIFGEIEKDSQTEETIVEITKTIFKEKLEKTNQPFFPNAAKDLMSAVLLHCVRNGGNFSNSSLRKYFDTSTVSDYMNLLNGHSDLRAMTSYIAGENSPQALGVLSELQQMVREVFVGNFRQAGTLSMREIVRNKGGKFVFIEYDLSIGNMLAPIYSLMFDMAIKEALSRKKSEGNVYFIADEFRLIPNLQHVDDAVNFGRSLGVKFMIGIQNVEQVFEAYGEKRARSIMSGFLTSVAFRVNDASSKTYIKELHGENRKKVTYMSSVQTRGITEDIRDAFVVEDWDISNLGLGEAIIGLPGKPPFRFKFKKA